MAQTPAQTASGAASFVDVSDKLAAIIYLLNINATSPLTVAQIAAGAKDYEGLDNKEGCIIYLLALNAT